MWSRPNRLFRNCARSNGATPHKRELKIRLAFQAYLRYLRRHGLGKLQVFRDLLPGGQLDSLGRDHRQGQERPIRQGKPLLATVVEAKAFSTYSLVPRKSAKSALQQAYAKSVRLFRRLRTRIQLLDWDASICVCFFRQTLALRPYAMRDDPPPLSQTIPRADRPEVADSRGRQRNAMDDREDCERLFHLGWTAIKRSHSDAEIEKVRNLLKDEKKSTVAL